MSIDELNHSLHSKLYNHFLFSFLIKSKTSQLIAMTHNTELLNNKDVFRNDSICFINKKQDGATKLHSLADYDENIISEGTNIFNLYTIGRLGAAPRLGNYYINNDSE